MTKSAFIDGFLPTLSNHQGALQGLWSQWMALIRMWVVPDCCQRLSQLILWIESISVTYWRHSTAVYAFMALIRIWVVPHCYQWLSRPILWIESVSVIYWRHSTTVCVVMEGITHIQRSTRPHHPPHPSCPPTPITCHPWYYSCCGKSCSKSSSVS